MDVKQFKVVLLGEGSVGKTSLFMMFIHQTFNPKHKTTLQATFETKRITLHDKTRVDLNIWDTAGQERFHSLGPIYYRGSRGAILVYDITDNNSFLRVQTWVKELKKMLGSEVVLVIVGNKLDLDRNRVVTLKEAEEYATSVGATHLSTSAKLNQGITEMFTELTRHPRADELRNTLINLSSNILNKDPKLTSPEIVEKDKQEEGKKAPISNSGPSNFVIGQTPRQQTSTTENPCVCGV